MQCSGGCACAGVTHRTACRYRARRYLSPLVPSQPPSPSLISPAYSLHSQPPLSLFLVSFANVFHPASAITSVTKLRFEDLAYAAPYLHILGIYGIRSRLRDTVPSLRFAATSQIRFVPSSDCFSIVSHSRLTVPLFFLSLFLSLFLCHSFSFLLYVNAQQFAS